MIAITVLSGSVLSIFQDTESRFLKMLDFPRIQFFLISLISLSIFVALTKKWAFHDYLLVGGLFVGMCVQGSYLIHYTPLVNPAVPSTTGKPAKEDKFSLLLANVKMSNRNSQPLIELVKKKAPDIVLAMEVDEWWDKELLGIEKEYPYKKETINDVAYGMTLYSKYPLKDVEVNYLNNENVPSFSSTLTLNNGKNINLYTVHPVPPTRFKDLPDNKGQEEKSMMKVGKKVKDSSYPSIVAGDFNDVVWSYTDELMETENLLRDIRIGRGFYNSYNAENIAMRWPLDHIFVTKEFSLHHLERLPSIDSDHFPIYVELVLE